MSCQLGSLRIVGNTGINEIGLSALATAIPASGLFTLELSISQASYINNTKLICA